LEFVLADLQRLMHGRDIEELTLHLLMVRGKS
jgi:hypothetical protein